MRKCLLVSMPILNQNPNTDETSVLSVSAGVDIQTLASVLHRRCLQWYRKNILSRFIKHDV